MFSGFEMSQLKTIMFMASLIWFKWQTELKVDINVNIKSTCQFWYFIFLTTILKKMATFEDDYFFMNEVKPDDELTTVRLWHIWSEKLV